MWREIIKQLLTFTLALLGALLGVFFGTWLLIPQQQINSLAWPLLYLLTTVTLYLVVELVTEAHRIERRTQAVGRRVREEIDAAGTIEHGYRDGKYTSLEIGPAVEKWGSDRSSNTPRR